MVLNEKYDVDSITKHSVNTVLRLVNNCTVIIKKHHYWKLMIEIFIPSFNCEVTFASCRCFYLMPA